MDVLTLLIVVAFYVLLAASIGQYIRHPRALELAVVLVFASTAGIFAITAANVLVPSLTPILSPLAVILLVAQPVLMLRLAGLIVTLDRWSLPLATIGFLLVIAGFYGTGRSTPAVLLLVGYFVATEFLAAALLIREGRRRVGFPKVRLTTAGLASVLFATAIMISGLASAARGPGGTADPAITVVSRLLALVAGLGYLAAFAPPRWLRQMGYRALAFELVRSIVAHPTGTQPRVLWGALAGVASSILGTSRVRITTSDGIEAAAADAGIDGEPGSDARTTGTVIDDAAYTVEVPLASERGEIALLEARLAGRPLFLEDDIALVELLGSLTARAVEREQAIATLAAAEREVSEAAAIRASEARFRALLDAEPNAMLSSDRHGVIQWCTKSADQMFGSDASLVGRRLDSLLPPSVSAWGTDHVGPRIVRYETVGRRADGGSFPAEVALSELELDGEPAQLTVVTDIAWRKETEEIRDRFIGVLSHELRTPITSIYGGAQLLLARGDQLAEATRTELLADVAGEADRLQRMVENLLIMARVERGADVADVGPVLLQRILPTVLSREGAMWGSLSLSSEIPEGLPSVAGDEASIALVLRNLISNAGKYAGEGAKVRVSVTLEPAGDIAVRVRDDGPGIDPEEADRLFTLYFRSEATASAPGSGIGLFVCRELIGAMGGRLWATGRPGGGAEFGFTLPLYADSDVPEAAEPAPVTREPVAAALPVAASVVLTEVGPADHAEEAASELPDQAAALASEPWRDGPNAAANAAPA